MKNTILSAALAIAIMGSASAGFAAEGAVAKSVAKTGNEKTSTSATTAAPVVGKTTTTTSTSSTTAVSKEKYSEISKECRGEHKADKAAFKACVKAKTADASKAM